MFISPGAAGSVYGPLATVLGWLSAISHRAGTSSQAVPTADTANGPATARRGAGQSAARAEPIVPAAGSGQSCSKF